MKAIYTIGHSVHTIENFISILQSFQIQLLADVRRYPGSKRHPQFNKPLLEAMLKQVGISYIHFPDLGGKLDAGFNSYSDYMQTNTFHTAVVKLQDAALQDTVAYMCAEADWKHCHRAKISAYLFAAQWNVIHISGINKSENHPLQTCRQGLLF